MTKNKKEVKAETKTELKEKCACGENCKCGDDCKCGTGCDCGCVKGGLLDSVRFVLKCGTVLVSAFVLAGAIALNQINSEPSRSGLQIGEVNHLIEAYIRKNPKTVLESIENYYKDLEKRAAAAEAKERKPFSLDDLEVAPAELVKEVVNDKTNYSLGNPDGKFVIIEFFDHQCGWCKRTNDALKEALKSKEAKNIRWIPIDTPIYGAGSETIARYVLAAGAQGQYAQMSDAVGSDEKYLNEARKVVKEKTDKYMTENNLQPRDAKVWEFSDKASAEEYAKALEQLAATLKLNVEQLKADAMGEKITNKLATNRAYATKLNINGVPMLIVDGKINPGALLGENLDVVVKTSRKKK